MDCGPLVSSVHGILQARITGVDCHFLFQGIFPNPEIEPESSSLVDRVFTTEPPGKNHKSDGEK